MILSVSRRTDIPCAYAHWFMRRIREGFVLVRNPMNRRQVSRVPLSPETVDCIVFWTRDALPLLPWLDELEARGYRFYFQYTLTPYGAPLEPGLRALDARADTLAALSRRLGPTRVVWRYDPILLGGPFTVQAHRDIFESLCRRLAGMADTVTVSFVDLYRGRAPGLAAVKREDAERIAQWIGNCAPRYGFVPRACCEEPWLADCGIEPGACIDRRRIEALCKAPLSLKKDPFQRPGCLCAESVDIGAYGTCPAGCTYCYATRSAPAARRAFAAQDPASPILGAPLQGDERITLRRCASCLAAPKALGTI